MYVQFVLVEIIRSIRKHEYAVAIHTLRNLEEKCLTDTSVAGLVFIICS